MLAQGQSSSAKRGGLTADVSSGPIFLKKKKGRVYFPPLGSGPSSVTCSSQLDYGGNDVLELPSPGRQMLFASAFTEGKQPPHREVRLFCWRDRTPGERGPGGQDRMNPGRPQGKSELVGSSEAPDRGVRLSWI